MGARACGFKFATRASMKFALPNENVSIGQSEKAEIPDQQSNSGLRDDRAAIQRFQIFGQPNMKETQQLTPRSHGKYNYIIV